MGYDNARQNEKEGDPPLPIGKPKPNLITLVAELIQNFTTQLQALDVPEEPQRKDSVVLTAKSLWHLYGQVQVFNDHLTVTLMRIWEDKEGWRHFDPRPGKDPKSYIELPFDSALYEEHWNEITNALHLRICALPQITYNNQ